ncbi:MAG TPA: hypothetical protein DDZ80_20245 [Cyanobacteria bacterium UBA8803]|nr:hypothetical protein [Cyanobacteria bacterium UBA9273]HBL60684.1 hypothetical protein [Cyanobacteria bacterium UBA8803]
MLNLGGSFVASSADRLQFDNGFAFSASQNTRKVTEEGYDKAQSVQRDGQETKLDRQMAPV